MSGVTESTNVADMKTAFAYAMLLHHNDTDKAAAAVTSERNFAKFVAQEWPDDPWVISERSRLLDEHGEAFFLPTRFDIAHKLLDVAARAVHAEDKLKALKQYSDLMQFVAKPATNFNQMNVGTLNQQNNNVMLVPMYGSDDDWEAALQKQQRQLVADAGG